MDYPLAACPPTSSDASRCAPDVPTPGRATSGRPKQVVPLSKWTVARNRLLGRVLGVVARALGSTLRLTVVGDEHLRQAQERARAGGCGVIVASWHEYLLLPALGMRDRGYTALVSRSADGEVAAAMLTGLGWLVRRGSQFLGGVGAARAVMKALRQGHIVGITPDGPRGPARVAARGVTLLALRTGCPLHPVGVVAQGWRLPTWDRLLMPFPFGRVVIVIGDPVQITTANDRDLHPEPGARDLEAALERCEEAAQTALEQQSKATGQQVTYRLFNALLLPVCPAVALYTLWRRYVQGRSAASLRGQWGGVPDDVVQALHGSDPSPRLWVHAVSVGETMAARPVLRALRSALPGCRIGLSVTTDTGFETAQGALKAGEADAVFYFPIDIPWAARRALRAVRPDVFLTMETELWPNFLHLARRQGAHTFLVNGRVSDNLLKTWPRVGWIWSWMMANLDGALMRSQFDADRLRQLGTELRAGPERIEVMGDVKLDTPPAQADDPVRQATRRQWREQLGIAPEALLWVAGSTHPGEETLMLQVYDRLRHELTGLRLVLAPRHIERATEVAQLVESAGFAAARRSQSLSQGGQIASGDAVILLDTVGELAQVYAAADLAFVGGSLIERGGHNLLEPVLHGVPVIFGPHVANFREAAALAQAGRVGQMVHDEAELDAAVRSWLTNEAERGAVVERARAALSPHSGAAARVAHLVAEVLRPGA